MNFSLLRDASCKSQAGWGLARLAGLPRSPVLALVLCTAAAARLTAQTGILPPKLPAASTKPPSWVEMAELESGDERLAGLSAPRGLQVDVVGEHAALYELAGMAFSDAGELYVLHWTPGGPWKQSDVEIAYRGGVRHALQAHKPPRDELIALRDADGNGTFEAAEVLMNDLQLPSGLCLHGGWIYLVNGGQLVRRRPLEPALLQEFQEAAEAGKGPPTAVVPGDRWLEQRLARGVNAALGPVGGVTIGADGWLYLTTAGNQPCRIEGWDGSRADVLTSGGAFQMRPDGSGVREFGRGLGSPTALVFDEDGNAFLADQFHPAADVAPQARLIHLVAQGDYGFRRQAATAASLECVGKPAAKLGTQAPLLPLSGAAPFNLLVCDSPAFPPVFRGLLLTSHADSGEVRALAIKREGVSLVVSAQFDLLRFGKSPDRLAGLVQGPDGAIYIAGRTAAFGDLLEAPENCGLCRILRLSWAGTETLPAVPLQPLTAWASIAKATGEELAEGVDSPDRQIRQRSAAELIRRAAGKPESLAEARQTLLQRALDPARPTAVRVGAIASVGQIPDPVVYDALVKLLEDEHPEVRIASLNAIGDHPPTDADAIAHLAEEVQARWRHSGDTISERAWRLALARLAAAGNYPSAEWGFESASVGHLNGITPQAFDAHVRALELIPGAASDLMLGNLEVALFLPEAEPTERQRLKEFVALTAEAMHSRELAKFLDDMLKSELDVFAKLDAPLEQRLIATYQNVEADPPIHCDVLLDWIEKHPGGPAEVDVAALETIVAVGTTKREGAAKLAERLLKTPDEALRIRVIQSIGRGRMTGLAGALASRLKDADATNNERAALEAALAQLK